MNKVFLGLVLAVCVLGMALVMLNDRLGRKVEPRVMQAQTQTTPPPRSPAEIAAAARALEIAEAEQALTAPIPRPDADSHAALPGKTQPENDRDDQLPAAIQEKTATPEPVHVEQPKPAQPKVEQPKPEPAKTARQEQPKQEQARPGGRQATKFVVYSRDKGATVRIGGNAKMDYSSMTLDNPDRVVVDLPGEWTFPQNPGIPRNELVSAVRVGKNGDKTRIVIDLKLKPRKVALVPFKAGDGVDVRVDR